MENKKNPSADLRKRRWMFFFASLTLSLSLVLTAFEWKSYDEVGILVLGTIDDDFEDIMDVPLTDQPPPPPPKVELPQIVEVPDTEDIEEEIEVSFDVEVDENTEIDEIEDVFEEPKEEVAERNLRLEDRN